MVFEVSPLIDDCDGGWCVPCHNVAGKGNNVAIKRGPVGVGEGEFIYSPKDSNVAGRFFSDDEESWPLLLWQGC